MIKRMFFLVTMAVAMTTAMAQDNPYIVKTKGVKKTAVKAVAANADADKDAEPTDFMGKNFRYYSMCDWKEGMRFMVIPEKYDLLVNTFRDAVTNEEVSSARLRYSIMEYRGYENMANGRVHVRFFCDTDNKSYYYELPNGTFDDYCYGKLGVPTLAYLGDVDKARELLMDQNLLTRATVFREDTEYDGDGYREVTMPKNKVVKVVAIGVGTRSFPVKIIVEDELGNEYYQVVAMSKTNSGMRDDEFIMDSLKHTFYGAFELQDAVMKVNKDYRTYIGQIVHNKYKTEMITKGDGKERHVTIPKMMTFKVDNTLAMPGSPYVTLTLTEMESRRVFYKDVTFTNPVGNPNARTREDEFFGYLFALGEGQQRETTQAARAAIQQGRVIVGMSEDEVILAMGEEPSSKENTSDGKYVWFYQRSSGLFTVRFGRNGRVESYVTPAENKKKTSQKTQTRRKAATKSKANNDWERNNGTPL